MNTTGVIILLVVIVLVVLAVAMLMSARAKRRRTESLQGRFGPEYDRAVGEHGDRKAAESHLADVADRRDSLEIRELSRGEQASYTARWQQVQVVFVDSPSSAVHDADRLINDVMRDRGYPVDDFDTRADMVAADHPEVVEHYRAAHAAGDGDPTTEEQRRAFQHYRALFDQLVGGGVASADHRTADETTTAAAPAAARPTDASATEDGRVADDMQPDDVRRQEPVSVDGARDGAANGERVDLTERDTRATAGRDEAPPTR
jgi:hypothetical protein